MRQMLKEMQQAGEEVDGEAVQKAAFPGGSSGSVPASAAGREAMPGTGTGAEVAQKASPLAWLHKVLKPLESPAGVSAGRTSPAPLLIPTKKTGSHGRGPLRRKNKGKGQKKPHEPNNILKHIVTELHKGHGVSAGRTSPAPLLIPTQKPGSHRRDWDRDMDSMLVFLDESVKTSADGGANPVGESDLASQPTFRIEPLGDAEGVSAGRTFPGPLVDVARRTSSLRRGPLRMENKPRGDTKSLEASKHMEEMPSDLERRHDAASTTKHADNIGKSTRVFCWVTPCLKKLMAIVAGAALCLMMCYAAIWYCWKRNWSTSGQEFKDGGCTLLPDSLSCSSGRHKGLDSPFTCSV
ncbi:uncharacterized protein LOC135307656 isoform X2 [Passer domesticus]|uniref:uncharacterized protein LOC135307656 isoform X2 n=2 Tax=Passer domesticus TaxID=48849 RepID=UPI0030FEC9D7